MSEPYWVPLSGAAVSGDLPIGSVIAWYSNTIPAGWLLCDGSPVPGAYADLIAVIGANTPDLRGRVLVGRSPGGKAEVDTLGDSDGLAAAARNISHAHVYDQSYESIEFGNSGYTTLRFNRAARSSGDADNTDKPAYLVANYIIKASFVTRTPTVYAWGVPVLTTLPGAPVDGDEVILVDSLTNPSFSWRMAFLGSAAKWIFIGGTAAEARADAAVAVDSNGWVGPNDPGFANIPAGKYEITVAAMVSTTADTASNLGRGLISPQTNGVAPDFKYASAATSTDNGGVGGRGDATSILTHAGGAINCAYSSNNTGACNISNRRIAIRPVYIG